MNRLLCCLIALVTALVYAGSFRCVFLFDDFDSIVDNPDIHSLQWAAIRNTYGATRPVVAISIAANYWIGGLEPLGYHAVNLMIHIAAALTLFGIAGRLLQNQLGEQNASRVAFVSALIFALHPIQTSAVTYIVQRMESLTSLFYLLAIYTLVRCSEQGSKRSTSRLWALASVVCFSFALFSKEVAITMPAVAVLIDRAFLAKTWLGVWKRRGLYLAYCLPLVLMLWTLAPKLHFLNSGYGHEVAIGVDPDMVEAKTKVQQQVLDAETRPAIPSVLAKIQADAESIEMPAIAAPSGPTLSQFVRSQPVVILHYFRLALVPIGFCFDYQWQPETSVWRIGTSAILLLAFIAWSIRVLIRCGQATRSHHVAAGVLAIFIMLSPRSTLQVLDLAVEYRMYLPMSVVSVFAAVGLFGLCTHLTNPRRARVGFAFATAIICIGLASQTVARNQMFRSRLAMWSDVVDKSPQNARARLSYSSALTDCDLDEQALQQTRVAVSLFEEDSIQLVPPAAAYRALGDRLLDQNQIERAETAFLTAFRLNPALPQTLYGLAEIAHRRGDTMQAIRVAEAAESLP